MSAACTSFPAKPGVAWSQYEGRGESLLPKGSAGEEGMVHVGIVFHRTNDLSAFTLAGASGSQLLDAEDCGVLASLTPTR